MPLGGGMSACLELRERQECSLGGEDGWRESDRAEITGKTHASRTGGGSVAILLIDGPGQAFP
ncbi:MAG: hypothetical protein ACYDHX_16235 [Methanothrix sp.]